MKRLALASAAVLALCPVVWSQTPPDEEAPQVDDKAEKANKVDCVPIMKKADKAMGQVKSLSYKVHSYGIGGIAFRNPEVDAAVRMVRTADAGPGETQEQAHQRRRQLRKEAFEWAFDIQGTARPFSSGKPNRLATWYDGDKVRSIREADKQVVESAWDESDEPLNDGAGWALTWAARWKSLITSPFEEAEAAPATRHEGEAVIDGVPCDVVYVDYSTANVEQSLMDAWWYIGKADSLPRRVDIHFIDTSGKGDGFSITTLTDLKADSSIDKAALAMKVPEGYQVKAVAPPERKQRATAAAPPKPAGPQVGTAAPEWALQDAAGKEHKLSDYKGKVVVLDFWATWCGPCKAAMPGIQAIHDKYKGKGVEVFGMNCWESADAADYMKKQKFTYGLLLKADEVAGKYGVSGIPSIFVIGGDGKVLYQSTGFAGEEAVELAIERGLKP